ncbi:ATP-binding protein [Bacillus horti]|uniref:histidine kinase n=1 Tax=Caldalkalibacillus horti TaxID=77523 RepID=A0ABT9VUB0_9BACI|nr:ATP-binding protein [Bacillus horti]MDQ0164568.1 two-component system sensor histidine kinase ResE [Bacillus horti]
MNFLWRSIVGKLWMTIIGLVTVVLFILSILLVQFFDRFYYDQHEENLKNLANRVAYMFETYPNPDHAQQIAQELIGVSNTSLTVINRYSGDLYQLPLNDNIPAQFLVSDVELQMVLFEDRTVVRRGHFQVYNAEDQEIDGIIVGVPLVLNGVQRGAVYLYQSLGVITQTIDEAKKLIHYAAGIGIIMTTVFAFFLSTRITSPLRQLKSAADHLAGGDFQANVSIKSKDEIGELGETFNHMAEQLNDSVQALSHEKEQLSSILKSMVDGVITLDVKGQISLINPPAEYMLNTWRYEENVQDSNALPNLFVNIFNKVVETEAEHVGSISAQGRFWTIAMAPLYNKNVIRGAVAVIRDMTDENRLDKLRKDFVANVSHELRTPLSMMQGYSEALIDDIVDSPEERKELAKILNDEALRMGRLVNELLDLARMEAGHVEPQLETMTIDPIVLKVIRKFANRAKEQEVDVIEDVTPSKYKYDVNADRLEQILTNLVDNALRHTSEGGSVTVMMREVEDFVKIEVKDTGSGISEEDLPFLFERFYKADKARTRVKSGTGTGLGLAIVKHLIDAHGGKIHVHSKLGEGTTFAFELPRSSGAIKERSL